MSDRRRPLFVALVMAVMVAGSLTVIGWTQSQPTVPTVGAGVSELATAASPPSIVAVVEPVVATTVPAPAPEPVPEVVSVAGSRLRRGVARAIASPATIADVKGSRIGLYSTPGQATADDTFTNPTSEGLPLVFLVQQRQGDWLEVQLNTRPNQTTAWVRTADVSLRSTSQRIVVSLADRSLTVYDGQSVVMEAPVAVGTSSTPTPRGNYYVDGAVRTPDPSGVYGPYQLSVAAFSEVLMTFGSGVGQIAMHGTNAPSLIGSAVSNGCLRMKNADVSRLASTIAIGTPIQIS